MQVLDLRLALNEQKYALGVVHRDNFRDDLFNFRIGQKRKGRQIL